jgi:hypothetical protein
MNYKNLSSKQTQKGGKLYVNHASYYVVICVHVFMCALYVSLLVSIVLNINLVAHDTNKWQLIKNIPPKIDLLKKDNYFLNRNRVIWALFCIAMQIHGLQSLMFLFYNLYPFKL